MICLVCIPKSLASSFTLYLFTIPQQQGQPQKPAQPAAQAQQPASRVPKTKVVDTRKATNVNLDKYDEKLQDMAERSGGAGGRRDRVSPEAGAGFSAGAVSA